MNDTKKTLLVLSIHQEMGESFVKDVCGTGQSTMIDHHSVSFGVLAGDPRLNAAWDETIKKADGLIMIIRFLDVISLDKIKAVYRRLPNDKGIPLVLAVIREDGESDFKMSCPVCGQKLWVRDSDASKRGRCPNCKKAFILPDQVAHIRAQLALADSVEVVRVTSGKKDSVQDAVKRLLQYVGDGLIPAPENLDQNVLKQSTIRVQINPEDV